MSEQTGGASAPSSLLDDLRSTVEQLEELTWARDNIVRQAIDAGAKPKDIAAVMGVSPQRVYQIRDRRR